jgi:hypothetical protein
MAEPMESLRNAAISNFSYFKRWYDFNFNIEQYLPQGDLEKYFKSQSRDVFNVLFESRCGRTAMRKNLLAAFGLDGSVDYDIGADVVRLAMAGKDMLHRAAIASGAIFYHDAILKIIGKRELNALVSLIGSETHSFILRRGMVIWKMLPNLKITSNGTIGERIVVAGKKILWTAFCGIPGGVRKRLELMFGEALEIPEECEEMLAKKCFDLIKFSLDVVKKSEDV